MNRLAEAPRDTSAETGTTPFVMSFQRLYDSDSPTRTDIFRRLRAEDCVLFIDTTKVMAVFHPHLMSADLPYVTLVRKPSKIKPKREPLRMYLRREWVGDNSGEGGLLTGSEHKRTFVGLSKGTKLHFQIHLNHPRITEIEFKNPVLHPAKKKATDSR